MGQKRTDGGLLSRRKNQEVLLDAFAKKKDRMIYATKDLLRRRKLLCSRAPPLVPRQVCHEGLDDLDGGTGAASDLE